MSLLFKLCLPVGTRLCKDFPDGRAALGGQVGVLFLRASFFQDLNNLFGGRVLSLFGKAFK